MNDGAETYAHLMLQPDLAAAISTMPGVHLRALHGYLQRMAAESGVPGLVRGLVLLEAADRFMKSKESSDEGGAK